MKLKLGRPKSKESITLNKLLKYKVWISVVEAGFEKTFPKDWAVPVLKVENIEKKDFKSPLIALEILDTETYALGSLDTKTGRLSELTVLEDDTWVSVINCSIEEPITFQAIIPINEQEAVEFFLTCKEEDEAFAEKELFAKISWSNYMMNNLID